MKLAAFCLGTLTLAFVAHLTWWRIRPPCRQLPTLLGIFLAALPTAAAFGAAIPGLANLIPTGAVEWFHVAIVYVPTALAYVATYSAVEEDSPSLRLVKYVADGGVQGRSREDLDWILNDDVMLGSRFDAMIRDGLIVNQADGYVLTARGRKLARMFSATYAWLGIRNAG